MSVKGKHRGHDITYSDQWRYVDTGLPVKNQLNRDCAYCGLANTVEGHDGCLGTLLGVRNACCGHGDQQFAYVQFTSMACVRGEAAIIYIKGVVGDGKFTGNNFT